MSQPTRDELIERLARAEAEREAVTMGLIVLELDELYRGLEEGEQAAAERLSAAVDALSEPLGQLAAIDEDIAEAEAERAGWQAQMTDETPRDKRARARIHHAECEADISRFRQKREWAEGQFQPLYEERDRCKKMLAVVQGAKRTVLAAMLDPFGSPLAQETGAYTSFRMPQLVPVLLRNDRESPEWDMAVAELEELCLRSAWRSDSLPSNAEQAARAMTSAMADASTVVAPAPSASEVMLVDAIKLRNETAPASKIEDHRNTPPPPRDYMQLPGRGAR